MSRGRRAGGGRRLLEIRGCPAFLLVCFLRFEGCVLRVFFGEAGFPFLSGERTKADVGRWRAVPLLVRCVRGSRCLGSHGVGVELTPAGCRSYALFGRGIPSRVGVGGGGCCGRRCLAMVRFFLPRLRFLGCSQAPLFSILISVANVLIMIVVTGNSTQFKVSLIFSLLFSPCRKFNDNVYLGICFQ